MDFPGGRVTFTSEMRFISESAEKRVPCYRVLDDEGEPIMQSNVLEQVHKTRSKEPNNAVMKTNALFKIYYVGLAHFS